MAKIFISHSSRNNAAALAVAQWLAENGWDDFFLDIEPARGLSPGERWQEALKAASDRCEAVLCLISPAWRDSRWCLAELLLAKQLGKVIFGALIEPTPLESLPQEITAEWQLCDLVEGSARRVFQVASDPIVPAAEISFSAPGLERLSLGLQKAGLDASTFPWPPPRDPDRAPYRGFKALAAEDAAVFFGREAEMVRGLDTLRRLRERGIERMLVLLGASGAGKSSFLRAGLWPRLGRDDRRFLPLPVIRPERATLTGPSGLAASLEAAFRDLKQARSRADIRSGLAEPGGLDRLLAELQSLAGRRLGPEAPPPTMVLGVDQAEEMLGAEGRAEAEVFLSLLEQALGDGTAASAQRRAMAVLAIRSDSFERLQAEPLLERVRWTLFDLRPLAGARYKDVIEGPAARATAAGRLLRIDPELTERLLVEAEGADALPLLAFTLERLFIEHGGDGALTLPDYETLGGLRGSIEEVVKAAFVEPGREPAIPADEAERTRRLKEGFIPWLARIDPDTEERKRRVASWKELPVESRPLIERLISARILLSDRRRAERDQGEAVVVEVAHEALIRQWPVLTAWLDETAAELKASEATRRAADEWVKNGRRADWLTHTGDRLRAAEALRRRPNFDRLLGAEGSAYLEACRQRDDKAQAERESQARRVAQAQRRIGALLALIAAILLCAGAWIANQKREVARQASFVLASAAKAENDAGHYDRALRFALLAAREGWLSPAAPEAEAELARAAHASPIIAQTRHRESILSASFSPDGLRVVSASLDGVVRVWEAATGKVLKEQKHSGPILAASFSLDRRRVMSASLDKVGNAQHVTVRVWDATAGRILSESRYRAAGNASFGPEGRRMVTGSRFGTARLWDLETGKMLVEMNHGTRVSVNSVSFSPDGRWIVSASTDGMARGMARVWDAATGKIRSEVRHAGPVTSAAFSADGQRVVSASKDQPLRVWDAATGKTLVEFPQHDEVTSVSFSLDGSRVVSASANGAARVWNVDPRNLDAAGKIWSSEAEIMHDVKVTSAAFSPDGRRVVSGSADGTVLVWDLAVRKPLTAIPSTAFTVSFASDGRRVVSACGDGMVRVLDAATGRTISEAKHDKVTSASFSPDGRWVVATSGDGTVHVSDAETGRRVSEVRHERVNSALFSQDGQWVISTSGDGTVRVMDALLRRPVSTMKHSKAVTSASFSPDSQRVVSASNDGTVRVWGAFTGQLIAEMKDESVSASFSPDGRVILSYSKNDNAIRSWELATGRPIAEVTIEDDTGYAFASFSLDTRRLISGWKIWDTSTGHTLADLGSLSHSSFSPNGRQVVTAGFFGGTVKVWDIHWLALYGEELMTAVCREKLNGAKVLSSKDIEVAPILKRREGEDVCQGIGD